MRVFASLPDLSGLPAVWAGTEPRVVEAAGILASRIGLPVAVRSGLRETDRSATGFLPPYEFETMVDAFFARADESVRQWERAVDAQARVVAAMDEILQDSREQTIAIVAHGGVGTLLL